MNMTPEQYTEMKARHARFEAWRNGRTSYMPAEVPTDCAITNEERSAIEVYEFCNNPPDRYFLYVSEDKNMATTWTGDTLGRVSFGREYRSPSFGRSSVRVPVTVSAVNGKTYHGTYYKSAGNYARVKMAKRG